MVIVLLDLDLNGIILKVSFIYFSKLLCWKSSEFKKKKGKQYWRKVLAEHIDNPRSKNLGDNI